jgi:hypothetical protein
LILKILGRFEQILFLILLMLERPLYRVSSFDYLGLKMEFFLPLPFMIILTFARLFLTHSEPLRVYPVAQVIQTLKLLQVAQLTPHLVTTPEGFPVDAVGTKCPGLAETQTLALVHLRQLDAQGKHWPLAR